MRSRSCDSLETYSGSRLGLISDILASLGLVSKLRVLGLVSVSKAEVSVSVSRLKVSRVSTNSLRNLMQNNKKKLILTSALLHSTIKRNFKQMQTCISLNCKLIFVVYIHTSVFTNNHDAKTRQQECKLKSITYSVINIEMSNDFTIVFYCKTNLYNCIRHARKHKIC